MIFMEHEQKFIEAIINRIDMLRVEHNLSIYELSTRATISKNTLSSLYKKHSFPSVHTILRICEAFNITLWQFFLFENKKMPYSNKEIELIEKFRLLSDNSKDVVFKALDCMK